MLSKKYPQILTLLSKTDHSSILSFLQDLPAKEKGEAFELFLTELYNGNGFVTKNESGRGDGGADILVYHKDSPEKVLFIVQAKNWSNPLTFDDTLLELKKFELKASKKYDCRQFCIVSINGFVKDTERLRKYNLKLSSWDYIVELIKNYRADGKAKPQIPLVAHNEQTYEKMVDLYKSQPRVSAIQATGTGKSYLIAKLVSDNISKRTIVLAPSNYILDRLKDRFHWIFTNTKFCTYQSLYRMTEEEFRAETFDLIILDEFHRTGAEEWGRGIDDLLRFNPKAKLFGTSATPIRYLDSMRDMTKELFNGQKAADISLPVAIAKGYLPEPTYISAMYTINEEIEKINALSVDSNLKESEKKELKNKLKKIQIDWEKSQGIPVFLTKHLDPKNNKLIIFCKDLNHLDEMEELVRGWFQKAFTGFKRESYRVYSQNKDSDNELEKFRDAKDPKKVHLLFCIDMLNEGLHFDDVGAVILLRPTISPIIFFQQIGRCLEVNGKHQPIIFDFVNNFDSIRSNDLRSEIKTAIDNENRQRSTDGLGPSGVEIKIEDYTQKISTLLSDISLKLNNWEIMFNFLVEFKKEFSHCNVPQKYKHNSKLGSWVSVQRSKKNKLSKEKVERLERIGFKWDPFDSNWEANFNDLLKFKEEFGHCNVPQRHKPNSQLGTWINRQRRNKDKLTKDKIERLENLGFEWNYLEVMWEGNFNELLKFKEEFGHCNVPNEYIPNPKLGTWVGKQRSKKDKLTKDKVERLQNIGFEWGSIEAFWEARFKDLLKFKNEFGHCNVPAKYKPTPKLGTWVNTQRTKRDKLSKEKIERLENIGFEWNYLEVMWEANFNELLTFKEEFGHCNVPDKYRPNPKLGTWVGKQRSKKDKLTKDKVVRLQKIGFEWDPFLAKWEVNYKDLLKFKEKFGHCNVPAKYKPNPKLGTWVNSQRTKKDKLTKDRAARLKKIGFEWKKR